MSIIVSDKKQDYTEFITEALNIFQKKTVKGLAVVALCGDENLIGFWNMNLRDKLITENELRFVVVDEFIRDSTERYFEGNERDM